MTAAFILENSPLFWIISWLLIITVFILLSHTTRDGLKEDDNMTSMNALFLLVSILCFGWFYTDYLGSREVMDSVSERLASKDFKCITPKEKALLKTRYDEINVKNKNTPFYSYSDEDLRQLAEDVLLCQETFDSFIILSPVKLSERNITEGILKRVIETKHIKMKTSEGKEYWLIEKKVTGEYSKEEAVNMLNVVTKEFKNETQLSEEKQMSWETKKRKI